MATGAPVRKKGSMAERPFDSRRHTQWPPLTSGDDMRQEPNRRPSSESGSSAVSSVSAFEQIYRTHRPSVFRLALTCVNRQDLAEDLTSETFLALYRNLDEIDASRLPGWLFTVVRNRARDWWRRQLVEQ